MTRAQLEPLMARVRSAPASTSCWPSGRGVIIVGGHFGNWELGGVALRLLHGYPLTVVGKSEASPVVGEFRRRMRESLGIETLEIGQMLETALQIRRLLAANGLVAMLLDRHIGPRSRRRDVLRTADRLSADAGDDRLPVGRAAPAGVHDPRRPTAGSSARSATHPSWSTRRSRRRRRAAARRRRSRTSSSVRFARTRSSGISSTPTGIRTAANADNWAASRFTSSGISRGRSAMGFSQWPCGNHQPPRVSPRAPESRC